MARVILADRYELHSERVLPEFDTITGTAFEVKDLHNPETPLFALKTQVFPCPRIEILEDLLSLPKKNPDLALLNLIHVANAASEDNPDSRSLVLIYQKPRGRKLMPDLGAKITPWSENQIVQGLIRPIIDILQVFRQLGISHLALRPDQMFFSDSSREESVVLGDCLSFPPGYGQDILFVPIPHALALPIGRGEASISVDMYALGVTIVLLWQGHNPWHHLSSDQIIQRKIELGSFAALTPTRTMSGRLSDLVRGLLIDTNEQRWTLKEVASWLSGSKQVLLPPQPPRRASRPIQFNNHDDIYTIHQLSYELRKNPTAAMEFVNRNDLAMWLKNSLNDSSRIHQMDDLKSILPVNASATEKLMGTIQILDREGPLQWQDKSFMASGLGYSIAHAIVQGEGVEKFYNLLMSPALSYYLVESDAHNNNVEDTDHLEKTYLRLRHAIEHRGYGGGIERCVYMLSRTIPCLSPNILRYNVLKVYDILFALNALGFKEDRPEYPIDRHIAAYIMVHEPNISQTYFHDLDSKQTNKKVLAMLRMYADLQNRYRIKNLQGLCKWFFELSEHIVNAFNNLRVREALRKKIQSAIVGGNLMALARLLDNRKALETDQQGLRQALAEVRMIERQVRDLKQLYQRHEHYATKDGRNLAVIVSGGLSMAITSIYILAKVFMI